MYRLKKDADLSFFQGATLLQICLGKNELILNFDRDVRVTILSDLVVKPRGGESTSFPELTQAAQALFPMLHDAIIRAEATEAGGLQLVFQSGTSLEIPDTSDQYESFWISHGDHQIVV